MFKGVGKSSGFGKHLIPLFNIAAYYKPFVVFIELVKIICDFLASGLDSKVSLSVSDNFFARIAVLDDEIAGIAGKLIVNNAFGFVDLNKMVVNIESAVFAGKPCFVNDF